MNNELVKIPNIGKVLAKKLDLVGITSEKELRTMGCENAFIKVKTIDPDVSICALYALEGAVQGIRWHTLTKEKKDELLHFFNMCQSW